MQPKDTEERRRAIDRVNRAYADEDYDRYERLIERYCHRFMLFLGLLFAVTVGWWVFLTLTVSVVFGNVAAAIFAVCSAFSVTVGYGLVCASDSRE